MRSEDVLKVTDQEQLYAFAAGDPKAEVRKRAAVRLKDDAAKKRLLEKEKDLSVQTEIVGSMDDEDLLFELASAWPNRWIRKAAILRLKDDAHLMHIIFNQNEESELRYHAATRISGQKAMKQILHSPDIRISDGKSIYIDNNLLALRVHLVSRLEEDEILRKIAADREEYEDVRIAAVKKLDSAHQDLLRIIAEERPDDPDLYDKRDLRAAAVSRLTNEELLRKYLYSGEGEIRSAAMFALQDQDVFKETVLEEDGSNEMLEASVRAIQDQDFLFDLAMHYVQRTEGPQMACFAAKKVEDPDRLADLAIGAATFGASEIAAENLHHDDLLIRVLRGVREKDAGERKENRWLDPVGEFYSHDLLAQNIQCIAAKNLKDLRPLVQILLDDPGDGIYTTDGNFKEYGIERLSDDPESLAAYIRMETDDLALECAREWTEDP